MAWTAGTLAVLGGAAAFAGGGGGGGGGGSDGCHKFLGDDGVCYEIVECVHGTQYRDLCTCDKGWEGALCDVQVVCDSNYVDIGDCPFGYYNNKNNTSCHSGDNIFYECKKHTDPNCKNGSPVKDECMVCNEGYEVNSDGLCVAKDCGADYAELGQCGAGMWNDDTKDSCQSASTMLYKCHEHKEVEKCASYDEVSDVCADCEYGYVLTGGKCEINQCKSSYYLVDSCPNGYWQDKTDECKQGEELKYNCVARNNKTGCATYDPYSDTCLSCVSNGCDLVDGKCEVHDCDDSIYALLKQCATGWNAATADTLCTEGTVKKYECKPHTAPTNLCKTYDKGKDACSVCYEGYTPSGNQCVEVDCGDSYKEYGKCDYANGYYNNDSTGKCMSGTTSLFKCLKNSDDKCVQSSPIENKCIQCKDGYTPDANGKCIVKSCEGDYAQLNNCGTGKYNNETTNHCKSGENDLYLCLVNDVANCKTPSKNSNTCDTCNTGYNPKEGKCEINQCGDEFKASGQCGDGYYNTTSTATGNSCDEGSTKKYKCQTQIEVDNCKIYSATSRGCAECKVGWNEKASSTSCPINKCDNYANVGACTTGWNDNSQRTCNIGTSTVYYCQAHTKVDRCVTYNPRANECAVCTEGYTGAQCTECDTGYKSDGNGVCYPDLNCQHGTTQNGDKCDCANTGFTGDECNVCESGQVEGDYCYPKLECQYGGTQNKNTCECPRGFSGDYCQICPSGDIVETNGVYECKASAGCLHGGTQENGMCVCKTEDVENTTVANWTGDKCEICPSGDSLGDTCFAKRTDCNTQNSSGQKYGECVCKNGWSGETCGTCDGLVSDGACIPTYLACGNNGVWSYANNKCECDEGYSGDRCECYNGWSGTNCDECIHEGETGVVKGNICYGKMECVHGIQDGGRCLCDEGWAGTYCETQTTPNNYNFSKTINVTKTDATIGENVVGLEHDGSTSNKIGTKTDLYNAYVKDAGTLDDTYQITVNNTDPANSSNTFGMKNDAGNAYAIYVNGINNTIAGVLKSVINVNHETTEENKSVSYSMYGIHAEKDVVTIKKDGSKANGLDVLSEINVTYKDTYEGTYEADTGVKVELYGIHSKSGNVHNTSNSTINVKSEVTRTAYKPHTYLYGAYSRRGNATNDGSITLTGATDGPAYGLYAALNAINNNEIQISGEAAAYGIFGTTAATNKGNVAVAVSKQGNAYGIRTPGVANLSGTLNITTKSGAAYGVHANGNITNTDSTTTVSGTSAYGLKSNDGKVTSTGGSINVTSTTGSAYGIYTKGAIDSNALGSISVKAGATGTAVGARFANGTLSLTGNHGISITSGLERYLFEGGKNTTINNSATISAGLKAENITNTGTINSSGIRGVWASSNITNSGTIKITSTSGTKECDSTSCKASTSAPTSSTPVYVYTSSDSTFANSGAVASVASLNLDTDFGEGQVMLAQKGSFSAPSLTGSLGVATDVVEEGFDDTYTVTNAIISDDTTGLNLTSSSALFDATLNGQDVVMTKKNFADVVENKSMAEFLENNYKFENNASLFETLKKQNNVAMLNDVVDVLSGSGLKRFNFEDMLMLKEVSVDMNNKLFENKNKNKNEYFTLTGNTSTAYFTENSSANSRWMVSGKTHGKKSYGMGIVFSNLRSYGDDSSDNREDESVQLLMPFGYNTHNFEFIAMPRLGYSYGTYTRDGIDNLNYDGSIEKRIFGLNTAVRYPMKVDGWKLAPTMEFNAINYLVDGSEENKPYALDIEKQNITSAEVGVGLNVSKSYNFNKAHNMKVNFGLMAYHEFLDPYELKLSMRGMDGSWRIKDEHRKDNHITINGGFEYNLAPFAVYGNLFSYIDSEYNTKADLGFKYAF